MKTLSLVIVMAISMASYYTSVSGKTVDLTSLYGLYGKNALDRIARAMAPNGTVTLYGELISRQNFQGKLSYYLDECRPPSGRSRRNGTIKPIVLMKLTEKQVVTFDSQIDSGNCVAVTGVFIPGSFGFDEGGRLGELTNISRVY